MTDKKTPKNAEKVGEGKPGPGRPPGVQNKVNATVKMLVLSTLEELGGKRWLKKLAKDHPQTFAQLLAKIMPTQVVGDVSHRFVARIPAPSENPEEWLKTYAPPQPTAKPH